MLSLSRLLGRGPVAHSSGRPGPAGPGGEGSGGRRALPTSVTLAVQDDVTPVCSIGLSSCFLPRRHPKLAQPPTSASAAAANTAAPPPKSFSPPVARSSSPGSARSRREPDITPSRAKASPSPFSPPSLVSSTPSTQVRASYSSSPFSPSRSPSRSPSSPGSATPSHRSPKPAAAFSSASAGAGDHGSSDGSSGLPSSSPSPPSSPRAATSSSSSSSRRSSSSLGMSFLRALRLWSGSSQSAATQRSGRTTGTVSACANGASAAAAAAPPGAASSAPGVTAAPRAQAAAAAGGAAPGGASSASAAAAAAPKRRLRTSGTAANGANSTRHSRASSAAAATAGSDSVTASGRDCLDSRADGPESGRDDWSGGLRRGSTSGASDLATVPTPHPFFVAEAGVLPADAAGRRSPQQELEGGGGGRAAGCSRAGVGGEWAAGGRGGYREEDVAGSSTWVLQKEAAALEAVLREARLSVQRHAVGPADSSRYGGGVTTSMGKAAPSAPPAQRSSSPSRTSWRDTFAISPRASRSGGVWHNDLTATAASAARPSSPTLPFRGRFKAPSPSPHSAPSRGPPAAAAVSAAASAFPSAAAATPAAVTAAMQLLDGSAVAVGGVQQPLGLGGSGLYRPLSSLPAAQYFGKPASPGRGRSASPKATTSASAASIAAGWPAATAEPSSTSRVGSGEAQGGLWQRMVDAVGLHKWAWEEWVLCLGLLAAAVGVVVMVAGAVLGRQPGMAAPLGGVAYQTRAVSVAEGQGGWAVGGTSTRSFPMHLREARPGVMELTASTLQQALRQRPTFVMFYAPWCPYCQRMEATWEQLAHKLKEHRLDVQVARVDAYKYPELAQRYSIPGFPTLMLFDGESPIGVHKGRRDLSTLFDFVDRTLP